MQFSTQKLCDNGQIAFILLHLSQECSNKRGRHSHSENDNESTVTMKDYWYQWHRDAAGKHQK